MSIFQCSKCGCVENTALSNYWFRGKGKPLCSECDPTIRRWHGRFEKHSAKGLLLCSDGFLVTKAETESDSFKFRMKYQGLTVIKEITEP